LETFDTKNQKFQNTKYQAYNKNVNLLIDILYTNINKGIYSIRAMTRIAFLSKGGITIDLLKSLTFSEYNIVCDEFSFLWKEEMKKYTN
jgi:hypothetical protein